MSIVNSSVFRCDRTFEIIDKLWLRDASYTNTALIKTQDAKYLNFLGLLWYILRNIKERASVLPHK